MARKVGQIIGRAPRTWMVRVYVGRDRETMKRKYLNNTIHGGLRDAQAHLNRMLGERDLGRNLDSSRQILNRYLDRWLELCAKPRLRAKSLKDYVGLLRRYVRPQLGMKPLVSVQAFDIQRLYRELLDRGLSPRSIRYTHAVLRSALKQAVRWKLLLANPTDFVDLPRHARRSVEVLSVEQARTFMVAIVGHHYEALFALAMTTGMRPSEYLALIWADIDWVRGTVSVSRTLEWRKGGWQFADTKRPRSRRVIKLQAWVITLLVKHRQNIASQATNGALHTISSLLRSAAVRFGNQSLWAVISSRYSKRLDCRTSASTTCATQLPPWHWPQACRRRSSASNSAMQALPSHSMSIHMSCRICRMQLQKRCKRCSQMGFVTQRLVQHFCRIEKYRLTCCARLIYLAHGSKTDVRQPR